MRHCRLCRSTFPITDSDRDFLTKIAPAIGGHRFFLPDPTLCPPCRKGRRLSFRNDDCLYRRESSMSGRPILSIYPSDAPFPVYAHDEWWSDQWDPTSYGRPFDFSKSFTEQFVALRNVVPRIHLYVDNFCENCDYSNQLTMSKSCYLVFSGSSNEDCYYGYRLNSCRRCIDCLFAVDCELCAECIDVHQCYRCRWSQSSTSCSDSAYLFDCQSCHHCLFCVGLRSQSYCIYNRQLSRVEYERQLACYRFDSREANRGYASAFAEFAASRPRKYAALRQTENVTGDNVQNARNCSLVFDSSNIEDVHYSTFIQDSKDMMDTNYSCDQSAMHYEVCTSGIQAYNVLFSIDTWPIVEDLLYCDSCSNGARHSFGSIGLRRREYCILNQPYSKEDYEALMPRIIEHMTATGEWGEFFPWSAAPFGYNESTAFSEFPLEREEALRLGFRWRDDPEKTPRAATASVPDSVRAANDDLVGEVFCCERCTRNYRIITQELALARDLDIPVPSLCPSCRRSDRLTLRNPRRLWTRECSRCGTSVESSYAPERIEPIVCEGCYLKETYG